MIAVLLVQRPVGFADLMVVLAADGLFPLRHFLGRAGTAHGWLGCATITRPPQQENMETDRNAYSLVILYSASASAATRRS